MEEPSNLSPHPFTTFLFSSFLVPSISYLFVRSAFYPSLKISFSASISVFFHFFCLTFSLFSFSKLSVTFLFSPTLDRCTILFSFLSLTLPFFLYLFLFLSISLTLFLSFSLSRYYQFIHLRTILIHQLFIVASAEWTL